MAEDQAGPDVFQALYDQFLPHPCAHPTTPLDVPKVLLSDSQCLRGFLSRFLGFGIVVFAGVLKLPQILSIIKAKSAEGISRNAYLIETYGYCYNLAFAVRMGYPITAYGEFALILLQNLVVVSLIFHYDRKTSQGIGLFILFVVMMILMATDMFPLSALRTLTAMNSVIAVGSRLPQIIKNHREGSVGALSLLTCAGLAFGSLVRVYTTVQDVGEPTILIGFLVSCTFNFIILGQVIFYCYLSKPRKNEKKEQ